MKREKKARLPRSVDEDPLSVDGKPVIRDGWTLKTADRIVAESDARPGARYDYHDWIRSIDRAPSRLHDFWWRLHELFARHNEKHKREHSETFDLGGES